MTNMAGPSSSSTLLNPPSQELRRLVLDYLVQNCYTNAARALLRDSGVQHLDEDGDEAMPSPTKPSCKNELLELEDMLAMDELRKDIRQNILTGRIDEATVLLNKHFPSVLADPMEVDSGSTPSSGRLEYLPSTSVEPSHLAINLRIQAFIETARRIPLLYYPPGSSTPLDPPPLLWGTPDESACDGDEDACEHWEDNEANTQLLHRAQSLYSEANQLPDKNDRGMYLAELSSVGGILAYRFPEKSPLADYMSQERREGIANQIDSAILYRAKRPAISRIELYARHTSTVWGMLHEKDIKVPPRSAWPMGVALPPSATRSHEPKVISSKDTGSLENAIQNPKKATADKEVEEVLPRFDFHLFVESQGRR